jgi:NAD(P)-dependent dehydrogenase (short-subunit alcohol dehydrogenase family)
MAEKVALVTGASSGIGEATARKLQSLGFTVYGAARRVDRMQNLTADGIRVLALDVTDEESTQAAIDHIIDETGRIDVLVNNAGYGSFGAVEDVPLSEARAQFEVNVFGAARLAQLVLPHMRKQGSGTIVNVSSMGGKIHTPLGGWYHATKFALEGLSDCLRYETAPFGIHVVVIEPGSIRSEWGAIAAGTLRKTSSDGPYATQAESVAERIEQSSQPNARMTSPPTVIADAIGKAATARRPKTRYVVGAMARPAIMMRRMLSDRGFDRFIRRAMEV